MSEVVMPAQGTSFLDRALVAPLFRALHGTPDVRRSLFQALIRLPLGPSDWSELAEYATWAIESGESAGERTAIIEAAPVIPVRSIRERVARAAEDVRDPDRVSAAMSLALVGDPRSIPALVAAVSDENEWRRAEAAHRLAGLDVSAFHDDVAARCRAASSDSNDDVLVRLWLALALARVGDDAELRRMFDDLALAPSEVYELRVLRDGDEYSGAPGLTLADLAGPALHEPTVTALTALVEHGHAYAALAQAIVDASTPSGPTREAKGTKLAPAWADGRALGFTTHSDDELAASRTWVADLKPLGEHGELREEAVEPLMQRAPGPFEVTALVELAGSSDHWLLGNWIVTWVGEFQRDFRPDIPGLARAYANQERGDVSRPLRWQVAWVASRGGLPGLIVEVTPFLAGPDEADVVAAGHLIADAADYVSGAWAPVFGGGEGPSGPAVTIDLLVDDWSGGNGHGAKAEPTEEAEANGHGAEAAPEEMAEANGHGAQAAVPPAPPRPRPGATRGLDFGVQNPPEPPAAEERWILEQAYDATDPIHPVPVERAFRAGALHLVQVQIGPERSDMRRAVGGPAIDEVLPADGTSHDLVLLFVPAGGAAQSAPVTLPPSGPTELRTFRFQAGPAGSRFEAQIVVLYQNRVLQTAVLGGPVVADPVAAPPDAKIEFVLAVIRPGMADLDSRSRFDAAVVVGHTDDGGPSATGVHDEKVSRFDDAGTERAATNISSILVDLANNPDKYAPPLDSAANVDLIRQLAFQGVELFNAVGRHVVDDLAGEVLNSIQVLGSDPNVVVPVEFIYDLPVPTLAAGLCPNWKEALAVGTCDPANHPVDERDGDGRPIVVRTVCPSGFWALSKVIERQVVDRGTPLVDLQGKDFAVRAEPNGERRHLPPLATVLFGASTKVDRVKPGLSDAVLATLQELTGGHASRADTWAEWRDDIDSLRPSLLVLLSHTEKTQGSVALEIGAGELRLVAQITPNVVRGAPDSAPIVLLLGCDTAVAHRELQSFVAQFRDSGAALVVGTIAAVLGEHAAPVAQALARALHETAAAGGQDGATFGVAMQGIRRKLLADGELMSLCLATYGDADWRLTGA